MGEPQARLVAQSAICDVLLSYAASIDLGLWDRLSALLCPDVEMRLGHRPVVHGREQAVALLKRATAEQAVGHHFQNVYTIAISGPTATALIYQIFHGVQDGPPAHCRYVVSRYYDDLRLVDGYWKLARLRLEIVWADRRADDGLLAAMGGFGPALEHDDRVRYLASNPVV